MAKSFGFNPWRWVFLGLWVMFTAVLAGSLLFITVSGIDPIIFKEVLESNSLPDGVLNMVFLMLLFMLGCAFLGYIIVKNLMVRKFKAS